VNIAELAIRKGTVTWSLSFAVLILGWLAYQNLPRLLEPELSVRETLVVTPYPGASAQGVEQEVSEKIEQAIRGLDGLRRVESYSSRGLSAVKAIVRDKLDGHRLPQVWDELRRKIDSVQHELPPGAGPSIVEDDFGEIHGVYYALVGEGFTQAELKRVAELVQRELGSLDGVKNTLLFGEQQETIFVEISKEKAKALGVGLDRVLDALRSKNLPADAGRIRVGPEYVPIYPSRLYRSEQDLGELLIAGENDRLARLDDVAEIRRGYEDPPRRLLRVDGNPAIGIALSTVPGGDLVAMGEAVERKLAQLESKIPLGMELMAIGLQPQAIAEAIDGFLANLALAIAIVIAALSFFM
jgi:multidrug efflux pump subunit AcrB